MSSYSPYNKTYRYMLYQNQAYHLKNKRTASPVVKTNLRHSMSQHSPIKNPENNFESYMYRSTRSQSTNRTDKHSNIFLSDNQIRNVIISDPIKRIHKHQGYQKFNKARIDQSNSDLVQRMIYTSCEVIQKSKALSSFEKHKKYSQIRAKFRENGQRNESFSLGRKSLLCPTLAQYMKSGLGASFLFNLSPCKQPKPRSSQGCPRQNNQN